MNVIGRPSAARLARHDVRVADRVEQRRLPVVDVPEHRHDRGSSLEVGVVRVLDDPHRGRGGLALVLVLGGRGGTRDALLLGREPEVRRHDRRRVEVDDLVDGGHHAVLHQLLDHVDGRDVEHVRQVLDDHGRGDADPSGCLRHAVPPREARRMSLSSVEAASREP
jgi:hypothetical protein